MMLGEKVYKRISTVYDNPDTRRAEDGVITGTVAYVHPERRYYMAVFETPGGPIRECFNIF